LDIKPYEADMRHLLNTYIQTDPAADLAELANVPLTELIVETGIHDAIARKLNEKGLLVQKPQEYDDSWSAFWLLDERAESGWATPKGTITPQVIVIALVLVNTIMFQRTRDSPRQGFITWCAGDIGAGRQSSYQIAGQLFCSLVPNSQAR